MRSSFNMNLVCALLAKTRFLIGATTLFLTQSTQTTLINWSKPTAAWPSYPAKGFVKLFIKLKNWKKLALRSKEDYLRHIRRTEYKYTLPKSSKNWKREQVWMGSLMTILGNQKSWPKSWKIYKKDSEVLHPSSPRKEASSLSSKWIKI